jgi:hypothetical protein
VPIVLKFGSLKLLEPSGPVQTCKGRALPLIVFIDNKYLVIKGKVVPAYARKAYKGSRGIAPLIFNLSALHGGYSSSSRAFPVANAPDVLQPCGLLYCP